MAADQVVHDDGGVKAAQLVDPSTSYTPILDQLDKWKDTREAPEDEGISMTSSPKHTQSTNPFVSSAQLFTDDKLGEDPNLGPFGRPSDASDHIHRQP